MSVQEWVLDIVTCCDGKVCVEGQSIYAGQAGDSSVTEHRWQQLIWLGGSGLQVEQGRGAWKSTGMKQVKTGMGCDNLSPTERLLVEQEIGIRDVQRTNLQ